MFAVDLQKMQCMCGRAATQLHTERDSFMAVWTLSCRLYTLSIIAAAQLLGRVIVCPAALQLCRAATQLYTESSATAWVC